MSFDLAFWSHADADGDAADIYDRLTDGLTGVVTEAPREIDAFLADIVAVYPDITDENMHESPWAAGLDYNDECLIATISWSRSDEVSNFLLSLAQKHGLAAYDPQSEVLHL
jgi:hypothetical protein